MRSLLAKKPHENRALFIRLRFEKGNEDAHDKSLMNVFSLSKEPTKTGIFLKKTLFERQQKCAQHCPK